MEKKMNGIKIGEHIITKELSKEHSIFFVAEIGINHNGSLENARKMIDMAKRWGCDAVKFQKRTPERCVPEWKKDQIRETPWGKIPYLEYKKKVEFGREEYDAIDTYCREKGILWSASAWDLPSFEFLKQYDLPFHKVASAKLTHRELLEAIADTGKPVFLSTGMSTSKEIKKAVNILEENPLVINHCCSSYPAKAEELNLLRIKTLQKKYPEHIIGYSGHEKGIAPSLVAVMLGARAIERHITLDRAMWGSDQSASLEVPGLRRLIRNLNKLPIWLGHGENRISETERKIKKKLRDKDTLL